MSRAGSPARSARASPSPVTAGGFDVLANTCPYPPVASTTARAVTTPTDTTVTGGVDAGDAHAGGLRLAGGIGTDEEIERERPVHHLDPGRDRVLVEGALHLGTALVATGVDDPVVAVAALSGERRTRALVRRIERRAEAHQVAQRLRRLGHEGAHVGLVAQPGAGDERVTHMVLERVARVEHPGQATLRPCGAAGIEGVLGDDQRSSNGAGGERADRPAAPEPSTTTSTSRDQVAGGAANRNGNW